MEFNFLTSLPADFEVASKDGVYTNAIREWEKTDNKVLKFSCKNMKEKGSCAAAVQMYIKKYKRDYTVYREKNKYNVYVVRS